MTPDWADMLSEAEQTIWREDVPTELLYDLLMEKDFDAISAQVHLIVRIVEPPDVE